MFYYISPAGDTFALSSQSAEDLLVLPEGCEEITHAQMLTHQESRRQVPTFEQHKAQELAKFRADRVDMLDVLNGIAGRAQRKGETAVYESADNVAQALLDLPANAGVQAATNPAELKLAMVAAYDAAIAGAAMAVLIAWQKVMKS